MLKAIQAALIVSAIRSAFISGISSIMELTWLAWIDLFQEHGGSLIMLAKGNRSQQVTDACRKHGGFYLGSIGGPAAVLAKDSIKSVEVVDFPELGMEAVRKIYVENFPAFILVDDKGNDFFAQLKH